MVVGHYAQSHPVGCRAGLQPLNRPPGHPARHRFTPRKSVVPPLIAGRFGAPSAQFHASVRPFS